MSMDDRSRLPGFTQPLMSAPFIEGFGLGIGLIVAIGAQNAFVLRQGLRREHLFVTALICFASDAILIFIGIFGFGALVLHYPALIPVTTWGGAIFVFIYGLVSFRSSISSGTLESEATGTGTGLRSTVLTTLAFTWLNPHVYLDTVILMGSVAAQYIPDERLLLGVGAALASIVWFLGLAFGAAWLAPLFDKTWTWRLLDAAIGLIMWRIAYLLVIRVI